MSSDPRKRCQPMYHFWTDKCHRPTMFGDFPKTQPQQGTAFEPVRYPQMPRGRAPRYPLQLAVRFRKAGESRWHEGTTVNISRSGVLFKPDSSTAARDVQTQVPVEISILLSGSPFGQGKFECEGRIVRFDSTGDGPAMAAAFANYAFFGQA